MFAAIQVSTQNYTQHRGEKKNLEFVVLIRKKGRLFIAFEQPFSF